MITLSESARRHLSELLKDKRAEGSADGLRLLVSKGGCAGMQYGMKFDHGAEGDTIVESDGVRVYVDSESLRWLKGCHLDYSDELQDTGFKIENPNAARSCGCGSSFEGAQEGKEPAYEPAMDGLACGGDDAD